MKEQKCSQCGHWNKNAEFCVSCEHPLTSEGLNKAYQKKIIKEDKEKKESKFFIFLEKMRTSKNILVKGTYYVLFSIWSIYMFFVSIIVFIAATTPG